MGSKLFPWPWNHTKNVPGVKTFPVGEHILLKTNESMTKRHRDEGIIFAPFNRLLIPKECQHHSVRVCS